MVVRQSVRKYVCPYGRPIQRLAHHWAPIAPARDTTYYLIIIEYVFQFVCELWVDSFCDYADY